MQRSIISLMIMPVFLMMMPINSVAQVITSPSAPSGAATGAPINPTDATKVLTTVTTPVSPKTKTCRAPLASSTNRISDGSYPYGGMYIANQPSAPQSDLSKGIIVTPSWDCEFTNYLNSASMTAGGTITGSTIYWKSCPNWTDSTGRIVPTTFQYMYVTGTAYGSDQRCQNVCYAMEPVCAWE